MPCNAAAPGRGPHLGVPIGQTEGSDIMKCITETGIRLYNPLILQICRDHDQGDLTSETSFLTGLLLFESPVEGPDGEGSLFCRHPTTRT